jgi:hypothetical protein
MIKTVVLMAGPYGSGKSKYVKQAQAKLPKDVTSAVCSSSFFFLNQGVYRFEATKLSEAFSSTRRKFLSEISKGTTIIFVDDTHLKFQYRKFYLEHAIENGYQVEICVMANEKKNIECDLPPGRYLVYEGEEDLECEYRPLETEQVAVTVEGVPVPQGGPMLRPVPQQTPPGPTMGSIVEDKETGLLKKFNGDRWIYYTPVPDPVEVIRL